MIKGLIFYSEDLAKPSDNTFDMDTLNIHGKRLDLRFKYVI